MKEFPLKPLKSEPRTIRIVAWDIETYQEGERLLPFLVGVRWGRLDSQAKQFQGPKCITEFLEWCLEFVTPDDGTMFFAHNGGGFDHLFAIHEAVERQRGRWKVKPVLSGGSAIMVRFQIKGTENGFMFADSMRLLNMSLRKIGEKFGGEQKQEMDIHTHRSDPRWLEYNNRDTLVLFEALTKLQRAILDIGAEMKATAASTSMDLFRRKYLKQPIYQQHHHHDFYRSCYYGGRVELFDMRRRFDIKLFDINSLYPFACTYPLPVELIDERPYFNDDTDAYFVECQVVVPDDCNVGPLPVRRDGKLIFPVGRFWGTWSTPDLRNLQACGGKIVRIVAAHRYRTAPIAREMMQDLYAGRLDTSRPEFGLAGKLLMNAWYGKLAQREDRDSIVFYPDKQDLVKLGDEWNWTCKNEEFDMWVSDYSKREAHIIPQIAAYVTALARATHYPYLLQATDPIYCDTDCIALDGELPVSTALGAMKLEADYAWFQAYLPKLYHGKIRGTGTITNKAKGFGGWNKEKFESGIVGHLSEGGQVTVKGPAKLRTLLMGDSLAPRERVTPKQIRSTYTKRIVLEDGRTKPIRLWET